MRRSLLFLTLACASALASASPFDPADELAKRSGVPPDEIRAMLSDCDANQINMNFCAWRDQVVAEQALQRAADAKAGTSPTCKAALEKRIAAWKKKRDTGCRRSARRKWGDGSILPAAIAMCATIETKRMTQAIGASACR